MLAILEKVRTSAPIIYKQQCYLNKTNLFSVYHALVSGHVRYCIATWNHGNRTIVQKVQHICNRLEKIN